MQSWSQQLPKPLQDSNNKGRETFSPSPWKIPKLTEDLQFSLLISPKDTGTTSHKIELSPLTYLFFSS